MAPEKQERGRVDNREVINDVLVNLFNEILRLEEEAIITDKYKDISNNDMHIIEAVGLGGGNMSSIAAKLKITVGSLTTSMNSLVKKGYVKRERSEKDRRVVFIQLTNKGRMAYHHHAEFHRQMTEAVLAELNEDETEVLVKALDGLRKFLYCHIWKMMANSGFIPGESFIRPIHPGNGYLQKYCGQRHPPEDPDRFPRKPEEACPQIP